MKRFLAGPCALALLFFISLQSLLQAQTAAGTGATRPFSYDVTREVTLHGTVSNVLTKSATGMMWGSHLLLITPNGPVDASLGRFALRANGALAVAVGQQVDVTGVMKTIGGRQVLLTRTVNVGGRIYTIRNAHGAPVSPQPRDRASRKTAGEGL